MDLKLKKPTLLLVDVQKAFLEDDYPGIKRNNHDAEIICGKILEKWRENNFPVIHVRHSSTDINSKLHESKPGFEFNENVLPKNNELVITKRVNSAFIGTDLKLILDKSQTEIIVIVGMTTNHCISSTVRMSGNYGYETYLISDSTACFNSIGIDGEIIDCDLIYETSLASIDNEFANVINSNELIKMLK